MSWDIIVESIVITGLINIILLGYIAFCPMLLSFEGTRVRVTSFHNTTCTRTKIKHSFRLVAMHGCHLAKAVF